MREEGNNGACRICGNSRGNRAHHAREMFLGTRDPFTYVECSACGTIQLDRIPELGRYYPEDYYSFRPAEGAAGGVGLKRRLARRGAAFLRRRAARYYCTRRRALGEYRSPLGRLFASRMGRLVVGFPAHIRDAPIDLGLTLRSKVLDVGSGAGTDLVSLSHFGFRDLTGVDPFLGASTDCGNGVRLLKAELSEVVGRFDLITANHSIEHVTDPRAALGEIRRLLKPGRYAVIRVPVVSHAWRVYGTNWVQLDPPRHIHLFTADGLKRLAADAGFSADGVVFDSTAFQFWGSEQYARDIALTDAHSYFISPASSMFKAADIAEFERRAVELNRRGQGDQAIFYLRRS